MEKNEYKESDLARALGISREVLKKLRDGGEVLMGRDWARLADGRPEKMWPVVWTAEGVRGLKARLGFEDGDIKDVVEMAKEVVRERDGVVVAKFKNPRIIRCVMEMGHKKEEVNVLVRDSGKFLVGMVVPLRRDGARWVAARHPRFPGKL